MSSVIQKLVNLNLISPPSFLPTNVMYETMMGSVAYGVAEDTSDIDIYGFCIPTKNIIFPHLDGEIMGFGKQKYRFDQFQAHHVQDPDNPKQYDLSIYNIIKYFQLCMDNNPNMIDSLFTPHNCVLHLTKVGIIVRENRRIFLHKGSFHKLKGYYFSQISKVHTKNSPSKKRKELRDKYGVDTKYLYHAVRLLNEAEQILLTGDLDLQQNKEQLKAVRNGQITEEEVRKWGSDKEKQLEKLYIESNAVPMFPDEQKIYDLLLTCLEEHYGSLDKCVIRQDKASAVLKEISEVIERNKKLWTV